MPEEDENKMKKRAACDPCRTRKVKCAGEQPRCSRCQREGLECQYSTQKTMGRPRKRKLDQVEGYLPEQLTVRTKSAPPAHVRPTPPASLYAEELAPQAFDVYGVHIGDSFTPTPNFGMESNVPEIISAAIWNGTLPTLDDSEASSEPPALSPTKPSSETIPSPEASPRSPRFDIAKPVTCACLSSLYLSLSDLQAAKPISFPHSLPVLRQAIKRGNEVLKCPICPTEYMSACQNVTILGALIISIAQCFHELITAIDRESKKDEEMGLLKMFRIGEMGIERSSPMHSSSGEDIPTAPTNFTLELSPPEWRTLARKVIRQEIYGKPTNNGGLEGLIIRLEKRQDEWHTSPEFESIRQVSRRRQPEMRSHPHTPPMCLQLVRQAERILIELRL